MQITPKTENDIKMEMCWPEGEYDFEITEAEDTTSKKGNEMIALKMRVFSDEGKSKTVRDWLLDAMPAKLRHFAYATGLGDRYEMGAITADDCLGRSGKVKLKIEESDQYGPKNVVLDYVKADNSEIASALAGKKAPNPAPAPQSPVDDDDIPF